MNPNRPTANLPAFASALRDRLRATREAATAQTLPHLTQPPPVALLAFAQDLRGRLEASRDVPQLPAGS
jgi:hypothetical protein